jgi:DNA-directed RNA polymerase sigma subunit (sigma70/sigma32)
MIDRPIHIDGCRSSISLDRSEDTLTGDMGTPSPCKFASPERRCGEHGETIVLERLLSRDGIGTDKLRAELDRLIRLRAWTNNKRTLETLAELITETEERLRQVEDAVARSE